MAQPKNVDKLLKDLQSTTAFNKRREAAQQLGKLTKSDEQIVESLIAIRESDGPDYIREVTETVLLAPVHQAIINQHPEWAMYLTENLTQALKEKKAQFHLEGAYRLNAGDNFKAALQEYKSVLALMPEWAEVHNLGGLIFENLGQINNAIESYQKAISLDSTYSDAIDNYTRINKEKEQKGQKERERKQKEREQLIREQVLALEREKKIAKMKKIAIILAVLIVVVPTVVALFVDLFILEMAIAAAIGAGILWLIFGKLILVMLTPRAYIHTRAAEKERSVMYKWGIIFAPLLIYLFIVYMALFGFFE